MTANTRTIMTPEHPRWAEFTNELWQSIRATGSYDRAEDILERYCNVDVEGSAEYFREHGGYDDLEILLNVWDQYEFMQAT